jgi:hypothetical protein
VIEGWSCTVQDVIRLASLAAELLRDPVRRDTRRSQYAIRAVTTLGTVSVKAEYWNRIWEFARPAQ